MVLSANPILRNEAKLFNRQRRGDGQCILDELQRTLIPKLGNLDSYYPMLCGNDRIVNVSQIKHLDGRHQPAVAPQMGRG
jgi:hypothetical protein